jgi:hypothetical protein
MPTSVRVGFVVDKVALGQVFFQVLWFALVSMIPPGLQTYMSCGGGCWWPQFRGIISLHKHVLQA